MKESFEFFLSCLCLPVLSFLAKSGAHSGFLHSQDSIMVHDMDKVYPSYSLLLKLQSIINRFCGSVGLYFKYTLSVLVLYHI